MSNLTIFISCSFGWYIELVQWWELCLIYIKKMGNEYVCIFACVYAKCIQLDLDQCGG